MLTIPAEIGAGQLRDLQRIRGGAGAKGRLASGEYVLETEGTSCFVGRQRCRASQRAHSASPAQAPRQAGRVGQLGRAPERIRVPAPFCVHL